MNDTRRPSSLRGAITLDGSEPTSAVKPEGITPQIVVPDSSFEANAEDVTAVSQAQASLDLQGKGWAWGLWLGVLLLVLGAVEVGIAWYQAWLASDILGLAWLALLCVVLLLCANSVVREWRLVAALDRAQGYRQTALRLWQSPALGEGQGFCNRVATHLPASDVCPTWLHQLAPYHSDKEILALFEQQVLAPVDQRVLADIRKEAGACAVMIAISPFVWLDMAVVMWRNLRLIQKISRSYGLSMGYWSRIVLLKRLCRIMLYAGASELLADGGGWLLGNSLTSKFSGQLAQGLGAGVLTARLGIQAITLCRPMPFLASSKPTLSTLASEIGSQLYAVKDTP